ncbi:hypothetical protein BGZ76_001284, partial [Entomortierella beljakovae]
MTLQIVRAVDYLERYNITRSNVHIYYNVLVGNRIEYFPETLEEKQIFSSASPQTWVQLLLNPVSNILEQHPSLSLVVGDYLTGKPTFLRLEEVDLSRLIRVVSISDPNGIAQIIEEEHNLSFDLSDQSIPLWRLTIAHIQENDTCSFYLLYTFHHVIADGRSAMFLTEQLIKEINTQAQRHTTTDFFLSKNATNIRVTSNKPIPDSIESRVNCFPSVRTLISEAVRVLLLPGFAKRALESKYWAGEIDSSLDVPNKTELAFLQFTRQETEQIVKVAKVRSTTVQSVLYTASVFAAKAVFMSSDYLTETGSNGRQGTTSHINEGIVFATPVSLRDLIPNHIAPQDQGNYTSEILHDCIHIRENSSFWEMTHAYRRQVVQAISTTRGIQDMLEHFGMLGLLSKKDGVWEEFMTSRVHKDQHGRKASIKLSNLGRGWGPAAIGVNDNDGSSDTSSSKTRFLVRDAVFSQSSGVTASALTMNATTADGILTIVTTWQKAGFRGR